MYCRVDYGFDYFVGFIVDIITGEGGSLLFFSFPFRFVVYLYLLLGEDEVMGWQDTCIYTALGRSCG